MKTIGGLVFLLALLIWRPFAFAYPIDGAALTGIERLEGYRQAQINKNYGRLLPRGARLTTAEVDLRLTSRTALDVPTADADFSREVVALLQELSQGQADDFGLAVLDLSDSAHPVYAEHRADVRFNPGSVGKLGVAMGVFQALASAWPDDVEARRRVLREAQVVADAFIYHDHHKVPFWDPQAQRLSSRKLHEGDTANLWTYLDWMLSASSNAAASMTMKHMMLLSQFGREYPLGGDREQDFFSRTPRSELSRLLARAFRDGLDASSVDSNRFRQGSFFSATGKRLVPGQNSYATPRELMRFLLHLEQGKVVDDFSSREIKRLLYMTQRRIRYASSPALDDAAVYFKSGSYYRCKSEEGFKCRKYRGNAVNLLNSVAIIESPAGKADGLFYMVVMTSNVLKKNAALLHQDIGTRLHRLIERRHAVRP
ncbi:serine hydrolase [Sulfuriflexus mobilis]|uniref:serine hydrolase n=1 Tax=Sulfuriflexus mobilis TaxID=1811807 RepID=UPI000F844305|nr:serine hydrolase [Sulfuriflexus mobilis]